MKLIILDRDGVINFDSDEFIKSPEEWHPIPGSIEAIAHLCKAGYTVTIASNQSGVGRGYFSIQTLGAIHKKMIDAIEEAGGHITCLVFCPHKPDEGCDCRKPKPGMLLEIAKELNADLTQSLLVGDAWRDIEAGLAVGAKTALVLTGKGNKTLDQHTQELKNIPIFADLATLVDHLLTNKELTRPVKP